MVTWTDIRSGDKNVFSQSSWNHSTKHHRKNQKLVHSFLFNNPLPRCPPKVRNSPTVFAFRETCIEIVTDHQKYWDSARDDCHARGGHLVVIPDSGTQSFIMAALRFMGYQGKRLWIGLSDAQTEHSWKWVTGTRLSHYSHWAPGESDNNLLHWSQDCVFLYYTRNGLWHDNACHLWPEYFNYICQYDMLPTKRPSTPTSIKPVTTTVPTTPTSMITSSSTKITSATTTTIGKTTTTAGSGTCQETNCQKECLKGYSGIFVGADGCVQCQCNL